MTKPKKEEYIQIGKKNKVIQVWENKRKFLKRWLNLKKEKMNSMQIEKEGGKIMKMGSLVAHLSIKVLKGEFFFNGVRVGIR